MHDGSSSVTFYESRLLVTACEDVVALLLRRATSLVLAINKLAYLATPVTLVDALLFIGGVEDKDDILPRLHPLYN